MSWEGDWMCGVCQHINFKKRDECQRCGFSKYGGNYTTINNNNRTEVLLAGDWYCQVINCGAHNYASRASCFRCGSQKSERAGGFNNVTPSEAALPGWKTGDWICTRPGCQLHNYACRTECYKCKTPRDFGEKPSSSST